MLQRFFYRGKDFFQNNFDKIFSWLFGDYIFLLLWESALPGMVSEVFSLYWLLLFLIGCLFLGKVFLNPKEKKAIIWQDFSFWFFLLIFSLFGLFFLEWWAVDFITAIFFSSFSLLTLFFLARDWSSVKKDI